MLYLFKLLELHILAPACNLWDYINLKGYISLNEKSRPISNTVATSQM